MRRLLSLGLIVTASACSVSSHKAAEISYLGDKFYGKNGETRQVTASPQPTASGSGDTQVISYSSGSKTGGSYYFDNSTHQAVDAGVVSSKELGSPTTSSATSISNSSAPTSTTESGSLRWKSSATELEKNYRNSQQQASIATSTEPVIENSDSTILKNPLQKAIDEELRHKSAETKIFNKEPEKAETQISSAGAPHFVWPAKGKILSNFGSSRSGVSNDGINIEVPQGSSIQSAAAGTVIYVGNELEGYGNLVILKHANNWITAYGHNQKIMVSRGDKVSQGQVIALSGSTGDVMSPQLYFSIRKGKEPVNPVALLEENNTLGKGRLDLAMQLAED